jgi:hypothetical protein
MDDFDCKEIIIDGSFGVREENIGRNNCGEIMCVHLRSRLLINLMEGSYKVEESTKNLQTVSMSLR